jgi:hypothetical protein
MTGYDVVFWSMRDILNGKLNVNPAYQHLYQIASADPLLNGTYVDPCGQDYTTINADGTGGSPNTGGLAYLGPYSKFIRFSAILATDRSSSISVYKTPAFSGTFRTRVWTSLDESYDIASWSSRGSVGAGVIDDDNPVCTPSWVSPGVSGDFSGYLTIDVANYCTQLFPDDENFFIYDAIATRGWGSYRGPNILFGDIFYKDQAPGDTLANTGNISGDPMVSLEFDSRLIWYNSESKTFYRRYNYLNQAASGDNFNNGFVPVGYEGYTFPGDGREPLGQEYGFRYLATAAPNSLKTWITVWRSDRFRYDVVGDGTGYTSGDANSKNLCSWFNYRRCLVDANCTAYVLNGNPSSGFTDSTHAIVVNLWDNDEGVVNIGGGPSGGTTPGSLFIYLESQRMVVSPNAVVQGFLGGWIDLVLPGYALYNQAFVGVQHSGLGLAMSVGHSATLMNGQFVCNPVPTWSPSTALTIPAQIVPNGAAVQTN